VQAVAGDEERPEMRGFGDVHGVSSTGVRR
jgi:hypothetical protein